MSWVEAVNTGSGGLTEATMREAIERVRVGDMAAMQRQADFAKWWTRTFPNMSIYDNAELAFLGGLWAEWREFGAVHPDDYDRAMTLAERQAA